ncbi:MAG TPA: DoxX family membrane protein [Acidisarcina sp.]
MKIAALIARILLGLVFVVFGLNGFFNFIHQPPMPGPAGEFAGAMMTSHSFLAVAAIEVIGGALLLAGQFIPLALTVLGPVIFNILMFHIFMAPTGLPIAVVVAVLWFIVFLYVRSAFAGIFAQHVPLGPV